MATAKTTTLTFRTVLKEALRTTTQQEHRSIVNMVSGLLRAKWCGDLGLIRLNANEKITSAIKRDGCINYENKRNP